MATKKYLIYTRVSTPAQDNFAKTLAAGVAEFDRRVRTERIKAGMKARRERDMRNMRDKKAVIYCRTASQKQGVDTAIAEQQEACTALAKYDGYDVVKIFSEIASGINPNREQFGAMLDFVKKNNIGAVYSLNATRLTRDLDEWYHFKKQLEKSGTKSIMVVERIENFYEALFPYSEKLTRSLAEKLHEEHCLPRLAGDLK